MQWELVIALVVAIPIILFPAAFVWYLNIGGIFQAVQKAVPKAKATRETGVKATAETK